VIKHSKQREAIRVFLKDRKDHPSAETVYQELKVTHPNLSLGTVYRNLNLLSEMGEIQKVPGTIGPDRFDGNAAFHVHFFCTHCDKIIDLKTKELETMVAEAQKDFAGKITHSITNYYGICPACLTEKLDK